MNRNIRRAVAAAPLALWASTASSITIDFGANLPAGPVPAGYSGFNWGTGANAAINSGSDADIYYLTAPAASIVEFGRNQPFDLNSVDYQLLESGITYETTFNNYTTIVSGYRGATLVKSVTEFNPGGPELFTGLNIDGVTMISFSTTDTYGYLDSNGNEVVVAANVPSQTFVDQLEVSGFTPPVPLPAPTWLLLSGLVGFVVFARKRWGGEPN